MSFISLVRKDNYKNRMIYRGMILRFFTLSERTYLNYKPSMKQFCNKELRDNRYIGEEKSEEYKKRFLRVVDLVKLVFGDKAFRRFIPEIQIMLTVNGQPMFLIWHYSMYKCVAL